MSRRGHTATRRSSYSRRRHAMTEFVVAGDACDRCRGTGTVWIGYPPRIPCPDCRGTGRRGG